MALTLTDLQEKLKQIDEISLMEILEISSEDLVQRFLDKIEERYDSLIEEFEEEDESEGYDKGNEWWESE
jgi:hypothetical protein